MKLVYCKYRGFTVEICYAPRIRYASRQRQTAPASVCQRLCSGHPRTAGPGLTGYIPEQFGGRVKFDQNHIADVERHANRIQLTTGIGDVPNVSDPGGKSPIRSGRLAVERMVPLNRSPVSEPEGIRHRTLCGVHRRQRDPVRVGRKVPVRIKDRNG
jgi:hypothetical protein